MNLTINGVHIGPLVNAELNRRYPDRAKMRTTDPAGFREAGTPRAALGETVRRARQLDPELLNESVAGEWSFIETLRHLAFASLLCSLNEEWEHRLYAERDLSVVEARTP